MEKAVQPSTIVVPRSGCFKMSTPATARKTSKGRTTAFHWSRRFALRASKSAANTTMANFISSEGWIWIGPTPTHRLEPPEKCPIPGTKTMTSSDRATMGSRKRSFLMKLMGVRLTITAAVTPRAM